MKNRLILISLLLLFGASGYAQKDVQFIKENFPDKKSEMKDAIREMEIGDEMIAEGSRAGYKLALNHYIMAYDFNPNNSLLNYKVGKCFLYGSVYKINALEYFEKAFKLNSIVAPDIYFMLGQAYHINGQWDKAINEYKKHQKVIPATAPREELEEVAKKIEECESGKKLVLSPVRVFIDNLGDVINTKYPEYGAIISADESVMIFTSRRDNTTGGKIDEFIGEYYEDIYVSNRINGAWTSPVNIGEQVNTDGHDATVNLSPDGQTLIIYKDDKGDGNLYYCALKGTTWSKPKKLPKVINTSYHESSACFTFTGTSLYYVSSKPDGGFGGHDLYKIDYNPETEKWGEPINLGPNINTKYDEESVFLHPDGKTLYFSSRGHNTMGGYDIFKSELINGIWSKPVNVGYPINTPDDDVFFVMAANGRRAYYSSFNPSGKGEKDIYQITFLGPEKQVMMSSEDNLLASVAQPVKEVKLEPTVELTLKKVTILKGIVRNAVTLQPIEARIELVDNESSSVIAGFNSNNSTGKYLVALPSGKNYGLAVKAEGFLFHSENFIIPDDAAYKEVVKNIDLQPIKVGSTIILRNIFFDFDKYTLRTESTVELDNLLRLLAENPTLKIEISGHTDNKGADDYNQQLSENRSKAVVDYLIGHGVKKERLTYKGYGETMPIASNDDEDGRQLNRRTEFKVLGL